MGEGVAWCLPAAVATPELSVCPPSPGPELVHGSNHVLGMAVLHARGTGGRTHSQDPRERSLEACSLERRVQPQGRPRCISCVPLFTHQTVTETCLCQAPGSA